MIAVDSSVVIAALAPWHAAHKPARAALAGKDVRLPAHAAIETVSSLSRMPEEKRISAELVLEALRRDFPKKWLALSAKDQLAFLEKAVANGVRGGALYDALIAGTVAKHSAGVGGHLISADRRAESTYEAMEVETRFVDPE